MTAQVAAMRLQWYFDGLQDESNHEQMRMVTP